MGGALGGYEEGGGGALKFHLGGVGKKGKKGDTTAIQTPCGVTGKTLNQCVGGQVVGPKKSS